MSDTTIPGATSAVALLSTGVRLHFHDAGEGDDVVVLLHGWPQTAWQWRHVVPLLVERGYRVVAPDTRGAGHSSRPRLDAGVPADTRGEGLPRAGYDKWSVAEDVHELLHEHLGLTAPAFVVGHDIGSMTAHAYALRYRDDVRRLCVGESPLPGTDVYDQVKGTAPVYHFLFHAQLDLPEALVTGREDVYLRHFIDRLAYDPTAVDAAHYVRAYSQVGALRAGFDLYRAFEQDAHDVRAALARDGRLTVPVLGLHGEVSRFTDVMEAMVAEVASDVRVAEVPRTGHWYAEENPTGLVELLAGFDAGLEAEGRG